MELRHLRYFVAVGEEEHFGRAALRLRVAQPALSRQIQDLEREIGFQLFDRLSRGVKLSSAGRLFLDDARERVVADHGSVPERDGLQAMEHETVKVSLANLRSFPCIKAREEEGKLSLRGAWFAVASGELHLLDEATGEFSPA